MPAQSSSPPRADPVPDMHLLRELCKHPPGLTGLDDILHAASRAQQATLVCPQAATAC